MEQRGKRQIKNKQIYSSLITYIYMYLYSRNKSKYIKIDRLNSRIFLLRQIIENKNTINVFKHDYNDNAYDLKIKGC